MPGLGSEALDFRAASESFEPVRKLVLTERVGPPTLDEIARAIDLTPRATRTRLTQLVRRGLVREVGTGLQDPKRRCFQAE